MPPASPQATVRNRRFSVSRPRYTVHHSKVAETTPASIKQLSLAEFYLTSLYAYRFGFTIIILLLLKGQWFTRVHGGGEKA